MRKLAAQVPDAVGRMLRAGHIKAPPVWFAPALANPPPHLTARRQKVRAKLDARGMPTAPNAAARGAAPQLRAPRSVPKEIRYIEDEVRRRFYGDFPFEAMRPVSLVELRSVEEEHPIRGKEWTRLEQRGTYPTVEDTIAFTMKLHEEGQPLTTAYNQATKEFTALRARYEMASMAAELEARHHGAEFKETAFERHFRKEREYLDAHLENQQKELLNVATKVKWKPPQKRKWTTYVHDTALPQADYSKGWGYVEKWRAPAQAGAGEADSAEAVADAAASPVEVAEEMVDATEAPEDADEGISDLDFLKDLQGKQ